MNYTMMNYAIGIVVGGVVVVGGVIGYTSFMRSVMKLCTLIERIDDRSKGIERLMVVTNEILETSENMGVKINDISRSTSRSNVIAEEILDVSEKMRVHLASIDSHAKSVHEIVEKPTLVSMPTQSKDTQSLDSARMICNQALRCLTEYDQDEAIEIYNLWNASYPSDPLE